MELSFRHQFLDPRETKHLTRQRQDAFIDPWNYFQPFEVKREASRKNAESGHGISTTRKIGIVDVLSEPHASPSVKSLVSATKEWRSLVPSYYRGIFLRSERKLLKATILLLTSVHGMWCHFFLKWDKGLESLRCTSRKTFQLRY